MKHVRVGIGLVTWCVVGVALGWCFKTYLASPSAAGRRVAADLWRYASAERLVVELRSDQALPLEVGDPIYCVDGPDRIEQMRVMNAHYDRYGFQGSPLVLGWILGREPTRFGDYLRRLLG